MLEKVKKWGWKHVSYLDFQVANNGQKNGIGKRQMQNA